MKKIKSFMATVAVLTVILGTQAFATSATATYELKANQTLQVVGCKSTNNDYYGYRLYDVYPTDGSQDTYKRIKLAVTDKDGNYLIKERVISESSTIVTLSCGVDLDTGDYVIEKLKGNDPTLPAYARIYSNIY